MSVAFGTHVNLRDNDLLNVGSAGFSTTTWSSSVADISVTTAVQFDAWAYSLYRSAEYLFQFSQLNDYYQCRMMVIHNGSDVCISEYAQVGIGADIPYVIDTHFAVANLELTVACPTANVNPVSMKFSRVLFNV